MRKVMVAAVTGMLLSSGVIGCSEEGAGTIGKQIGNAAEKATVAASNAMEKTTEAASSAAKDAGKVINQWTDHVTSEEKSGNKRTDTRINKALGDSWPLQGAFDRQPRPHFAC